MPCQSPASCFPAWTAPSAASCRAVHDALAEVHGVPRRGADAAEADCGRVDQVLEALVRTILSQNTTNANSRASMRALMAHFGGSLDRVADAPRGEVVACLRAGGLANVKAARIQALLAEVREEYGTLSLEHLRELPDDQVHLALTRYRGVGHKTASCVALFCLGRARLAVDTHVHRLARQLGWAPPAATRDQVYHHLDARVPDPLKYPLHVLLVRHGQCCPRCRAAGHRQRRPADALLPCPLRPRSATRRGRWEGGPESGSPQAATGQGKQR